MVATPKPGKKSKPASLTKSSKKKDIELKEDELKRVTGGVIRTKD